MIINCSHGHNQRVIKANLKRYTLIIIIILLLPQIFRIYNIWVKLAKNEPFFFTVIVPENLASCKFSFSNWQFLLKNCLEYQTGSQIQLIGRVIGESDKQNQRSKKLNTKVLSVRKNWLTSGLAWWQTLINLTSGVREGVIQSLIGYLPSSHFSLLMDVAFGKVVQLPSVIHQQLKTIGMLHVVAASGFNVMIVSNILDIISRRFSRFWQTLIWAVGMGVYLLFSDLSVSIIRAGLMLSLKVIAVRGAGRIYHGLYSLTTACLLILLLMPQQLFNLSFQLSVGATVGLILFGNFFDRRLGGFVGKRGAWKLVRQFILEPLSTSLAAQVFTLPILMATFGEVSPLAFLTSIFLLWLTPTLTLGGLLFFALGSLVIVIPLLAPILKFLSLYMWLYTNLFLTISQWLSSLAIFQLKWQPTWISLVILYLVFGFLVWYKRKNDGKKRSLMAGNYLV